MEKDWKLSVELVKKLDTEKGISVSPLLEAMREVDDSKPDEIALKGVCHPSFIKLIDHHTKRLAKFVLFQPILRIYFIRYGGRFILWSLIVKSFVSPESVDNEPEQEVVKSEPAEDMSPDPMSTLTEEKEKEADAPSASPVTNSVASLLKEDNDEQNEHKNELDMNSCLEGKLDLILTYLWEVHLIDYYAGIAKDILLLLIRYHCFK